MARNPPGRDYRTNVREVGGRAADGADRENARRTRGRGTNAPQVIRQRVMGVRSGGGKPRGHLKSDARKRLGLDR